MKLLFINLCPTGSMAKYLLSSYVLKAYLKEKLDDDSDLLIDIFNFSVEIDAQKICEEISKYKPDYIGYSCYIWNIEKILEIIQMLKGRLNYVHVLGGPEISLSRILSLQDPSIVDYYVIYEGEKKLLYLVDFLIAKSKGLDIAFPKGVAYWDNNKISYVEDTDSMINLDEIPSVYLSGVLAESLYARQQAFIETQRGCKFKCKFCLYHKNLSSVSYYSLQRIFDELYYLIVKKQIMVLRIFDSVFTSDLNRAKEIVRYLLKLKIDKDVRLPRIYWELRYENTDKEFIELTSLLKYRTKILNTNNICHLDRPQLYSDMLKDYTAISSIGIESFCRQTSNAVGRSPINVKKFNVFMDMVMDYNIAIKIDLIIGLPLETFDSYFEGIEFLLPYLKNTDHILNIHRLQILPGSDLESQCGFYGIKYSEKAPHVVILTKSFSEQEINYASKLNAVLFRVLNSPLRQHYFSAKERTGESFCSVIKIILKDITASGEFKKTKLVQNDSVDDEYWNDEIFREIPSRWLLDFLENY